MSTSAEQILTIHAVTDAEHERALELRVVGCRFLPPEPADLLMPSGRPDPRAERDPNWGWREITLRPLLFGTWQLCIGPRGDEFGFDDSYTYRDYDRAVYALNNWYPTEWAPHPPDGWIRHDNTGERRRLP
jgi:hypothetical protein